ncbi:MAG: hypothetical protein WHV26_08120 [Spirochaetota bacterium]
MNIETTTCITLERLELLKKICQFPKTIASYFHYKFHKLCTVI